MIITDLQNKPYKVIVECDYKISPNCKNIFEVLRSTAIKVQKKQDKYPCYYCARHGRNNPNCNNIYLNDNFFESIDSYEKAYILGYIASDGHLAKSKDRTEITSIDKDIIEKIRNYICPNLKIKVKIHQNQNYKTQYHLILYSSKINHDICNILNIHPGKKCHLVTLPTLKENFIDSFIGGFFDGDGYINKDFNTSLVTNISSTSLSMLQQIQSRFKSIDMHLYLNENYNKIRPKQWQNIYSLNAFGQHSINFLDTIYMNSNIYMDRKYQLYKQWKYIYEKKSQK